MFVIPKKDLLIIDPARQTDPLFRTLPPEGRDVGEGDSHYWIRRQQDGDVEIVADDKVEAAKANAIKAQAKRDQDAAAAAKALEKPADAPKAPQK